ncbi:hypothetical protein EV426DRAFT_614362 [Tirmania nivea]|nr:hypothetical protein EV426DRAFT_614362 [Tirmania nivea]
MNIFDSISAPSSPTTGPSTLYNQDLVKLQSTHVTEGYRAAISVSKGQFIQAGFDRGYEFGGKMGLVAGWVRGVAEGLVYAAGEGEMAKEMKGLMKQLEREVVVEKLLGREWIDEEGGWRWKVLSWEGEKRVQREGGIEEVDLDLVVQSHPVLRKWVERLTDVAGKLGLNIHGPRGDEEGVGEIQKGAERSESGSGRVENGIRA